MKTKHVLTFAILFLTSTLHASDAATRVTTSLLNNEAGNKGGDLCPMVSSAYGYGCETGSGCLTAENAAQVLKSEIPSQKTE